MNNFDKTSCLFGDSVWNDKKREMESFRNNNTRSLPVDRKGLYSNLPRMRLCYLSTKRVERGPLFESFITKVSSHTGLQNIIKISFFFQHTFWSLRFSRSRKNHLGNAWHKVPFYHEGKGLVHFHFCTFAIDSMFKLER